MTKNAYNLKLCDLCISCVAILCFCCVEIIVVLLIKNGEALYKNIVHWTIRCRYVIRAICVIFFIMSVYTSVFLSNNWCSVHPLFHVILSSSNLLGGKNKQKTDTKMPLLCKKVAFFINKIVVNSCKLLCINKLYDCLENYLTHKKRQGENLLPFMC